MQTNATPGNQTQMSGESESTEYSKTKILLFLNYNSEEGLLYGKCEGINNGINAISLIKAYVNEKVSVLEYKSQIISCNGKS